MIFEKTFKNKGLRLTFALLLLGSLLLSLASCTGGKAVASINDEGIISYEGRKYLPVNTEGYNSLVFDSETLLGKVDGLVNTNIYKLRYVEKDLAIDTEKDDFLCIISPQKEKTLYVYENYEFKSEGREITNVFLQYKNGFMKNVDDKNDYKAATSLDSIRGELVNFELDIEDGENNWVSIYACYNRNPVGTFWFGSLVKSDEKIYYVYPNDEGRSLSQLFINERDADAPTKYEFSGYVIDDETLIADIQRVIGLS